MVGHLLQVMLSCNNKKNPPPTRTHAHVPSHTCKQTQSLSPHMAPNLFPARILPNHQPLHCTTSTYNNWSHLLAVSHQCRQMWEVSSQPNPQVPSPELSGAPFLLLGDRAYFGATHMDGLVFIYGSTVRIRATPLFVSTSSPPVLIWTPPFCSERHLFGHNCITRWPLFQFLSKGEIVCCPVLNWIILSLTGLGLPFTSVSSINQQSSLFAHNS